LALDGSKQSFSCPGPFTCRVRAFGAHWIGGWVDCRAGLDMVAKRKNPTIDPTAN